MARTPVIPTPADPLINRRNVTARAEERERKDVAKATAKAVREASRLAEREAADAKKAERKRLRDEKADARAAKLAARIEGASTAEAWKAINTVGAFRFQTHARPGLDLVNVEPKRVWATNGSVLFQLDVALPERFMGRWRKVEVQATKRMTTTWELVPPGHPDSPSVDKLTDRATMRPWAEVDGGVLLTLAKMLEPMPESYFTFLTSGLPALTLKPSKDDAFAQPVIVTGEKNWVKGVHGKFSINATFLAQAAVALATKEKVPYKKSWKPVVGWVQILGTAPLEPMRVESQKGHAIIMPVA